MSHKLKYIVIMNGIPIPIVRGDIESKILAKKATFKDIKDELRYVVENFSEVMAQEGVLEALMEFFEEYDLREYREQLTNILVMLEEGEIAGGSEVSVMFEQSGDRLTLERALNTRIASIVEAEPVNTGKGLFYVYKFGVARTGRVGGGSKV